MTRLATKIPSALAALVIAASGASGQTTAVPASDFLDSLGVCTHITQGADNPTNVATALTYTGIRAFRDDNSTNQTVIQKWIDVYNTTGARALIAAPHNGNSLDAYIDTYEQVAQAGALFAIEGPNEPNNFPCTYNGQSSGGSLLTTTTVATINNSARYVSSYVNEASGPGKRCNGPLAFKYGSGTAFVTNQMLGVLRNDTTGWVGCKFTVGATAITVNELARWVVSGNTQSHAVRLVRVSDSAVLGSVSIATSGAPVGFKYATLTTPVTLAANTAYYLMSQETSGGDWWCDGQYNALPTAWTQRDLYSAVKSNPTLSDYDVFSASTAAGSQPNNCGLQYLTIPTPLPSGVLLPAGTQYADFANMHNYVCSGSPQLGVRDNQAWNTEEPLDLAGWYTLYDEYGHTWWAPTFSGYNNTQLLTLPRVTTETGWYTVALGTGQAYPITETQQGKLFLNLYLAAYKRGWSATFIYMLHDDSVQGYWGLYHTDWSPKLSATYLHNMTTILADTVSFTPGSLNYSIPSQPATVHDLLIQKSDGKFMLAVWNERASGSDAITVNLGATFATVKVYDPTVGTAVTQTLNNVSSVPLTLSDHPVIIEVSGAVSTLPSPWVTQAVGTVGTPGNASYSGGTFTVNGSGWDISGTADSFQYVYQAMSGDCSITARVVTQQNTSVNAKAGIMIRETLAAGSRNAAVFVKPPAGGIYFRWRATTDGNSGATYAGLGGIGAPYWMRITRVGNTFTAYRSPDNVTWTQLGTPQTIAMGNSVYIGLAQTSSTTALGTSTFSNVSVAGASGSVNFNSTPPSAYAAQDTSNGSVAVQDGGATLKLTGNRWQKVSYPYTITPNTVLEFDFKSPVQGELHAIGVETDNTEGNSGSAFFQLYGTQSWGYQTYRDYSGTDWKHYTISVGATTTGAKSYLVFVNDKDSAPFTNESYFRNVQLHE